MAAASWNALSTSGPGIVLTKAYSDVSLSVPYVDRLIAVLLLYYLTIPMLEVPTIMIIGDRLRILREQKKFSQGEIEKRTGLLRCYISRVENGHTVPAVETLEKFARALEVPLYQL